MCLLLIVLSQSVEEGAELPEDQFPDGGPTALAEFFGDVMLVNGECSFCDMLSMHCFFHCITSSPIALLFDFN